MIQDLKQRLKEEYLNNEQIIKRYLRNDNDFDKRFLDLRKRNAEIVAYLMRVFKMSEDSVCEFLEEDL